MTTAALHLLQALHVLEPATNSSYTLRYSVVRGDHDKTSVFDAALFILFG